MSHFNAGTVNCNCSHYRITSTVDSDNEFTTGTKTKLGCKLMHIEAAGVDIVDVLSGLYTSMVLKASCETVCPFPIVGDVLKIDRVFYKNDPMYDYSGKYLDVKSVLPTTESIEMVVTVSDRDYA